MGGRESGRWDARREAHALGDAHGLQVRASQKRQRALCKALRGVVEALKSHPARQHGEAQGRFSVAGSDLLFPTTIGTTISGTNLTRRHFKLLLKKAGLAAIGLQDLRYTCATIRLTAGKYSRFVQELLRPQAYPSRSTPMATLSRAWTVGWPTRWTRLSDGLLLTYCCHRGFRLDPEVENPA